MTSLALSVLLALASAVCYAAGAILQEYVAATTPRFPSAPLRRGSWWAAVTLNGTGAVLHVIALAYGPLSVVQPLGALTIVFALPMAAVFVRRRVGAAGWRGAVLATAGLAGLLSLTGSARAQSLADQERIAVTVATVGAIALLAGTARWIRLPGVRSVLLATAAGTAFGISSVFTKNVAVEWNWDSLGDALPSLVMIGLLASGGVLLSQASYRGAGLASPLATATVVNPVVATAVGIAALGEHFRFGTPGTLLALVAALVASTGLVMLTVHGAEAEAERAGAAGFTGKTEAVEVAELVEVAGVAEVAGEREEAERTDTVGATDTVGTDEAGRTDEAAEVADTAGDSEVVGAAGPGLAIGTVGAAGTPGRPLHLTRQIPRQLSSGKGEPPSLPDCGEAMLQPHG
ncbi:DMT family transporter [Streptomyces sp. NA02950]|uniref:DMT family transporter n=1 Tax=Streptomyces sp. NA02950 TaxID=2742137 RepID=UPI00159060CA|nr:DMT family transporter [Streptomyces sp. NA02950]QKV91058.1 DMT family transporter [Streptomyces sp. NA02950]